MNTNNLSEMLNYDSATGLFTWKVRPPHSRCKIGAIAGNIITSKTCPGYRRISVGGHTYLAHRLAWLFVHGEFPSGGIDHKNGNRDDNRISNLRLASAVENGGNRNVGVNNTSGFKGVSFKRGAWEAYIAHNGNRYYLGRHRSKADAAAAYRNAAEKLFGQFARVAA